MKLILLTIAAVIIYGFTVYNLATMPAPELQREFIASACSTDAECNFWADRMGGE